MTKKGNLQKVWSALYWVFLFYFTVRFLLGKADTAITVLLAIIYVGEALNLILSLVRKIIKKVNDHQFYKLLVNRFEDLQTVHEARYRLYFTGNKEEIEEYSEVIENEGKSLVDFGKFVISRNLLSKKHTQKVQEILNQTQKLMATVK